MTTSPPLRQRAAVTDSPVDPATLERLVAAFYDRARHDEMLAPVFARVADDAWPDHIARVVGFWRSVLFHDGSYRGNPMRTHAAMPELTPGHFHRWLAIWRETAIRTCPPVAAMLMIDKAERMAAALAGGHPTAGAARDPQDTAGRT
ncbi:group III truncated hemoglobin [Tistrella mobilis]|uniref:Preprotein translocase subunit TatC n=1 Tax=Tistrella mobilis TaxID=171437 RepID=A0A162LVW0_9PROT|nr:group III truncated hemoglobin [Tistrella mobilis]KYO57366.1 hypothetical protein AUP44_20440 [Tistrella mobilis]